MRLATMTSLPPSVLHVSQPTTEGVARCVLDLVAAQRARGWRVAVASPRSGWLAAKVAETGASYVEWPARRLPGPWVPAEVTRLARIVKKVDPDVVHLFSSKAGLVGRLAIRGDRPTLFQPEGWSFAFGGPVAPFARIWERAATRWTDVLVCCSQSELEAAKAAALPIDGTAEVVPNAVDIDVYRPGSDQDRLVARRRLGLGEEPLVVCVGRLCPQKGQDLLLDAWPDVLEAVPTAQLLLLGDGPDRTVLEERNSPRVRFLGPREDVAPWLTAADVVALPSRYEGMAITMLEAMASARSVVAHDVEGMAEALTPEGRPAGGAVVPVGDRAALSAGIVHRLLHPEVASAEGAAGRRMVEDNHSVSAWGERLCAMTERVLAQRAAPRS
jgi:glycosyltransferase involved in cell wall biosynthesis